MPLQSHCAILSLLNTTTTIRAPCPGSCSHTLSMLAHRSIFHVRSRCSGLRDGGLSSGEMVDFQTLFALLVSSVALGVALINLSQVIQLYASTGHQYSHCSARVMGGWAKRTRRKFIWSDFRFEVTFCTPRITIDVNHDVDTSDDGHAISIDTQSPLYLLKDVSQKVSSDGRESTVPKWQTVKDKPWFLSAKGAVDEAKCPWLNFLEDTAFTNLRITLAVQRSSYDYMPEGQKRPVAAVDGGSFLTIMSLFGIRWNNRGADGKFTGIAESGLCEVSSISIFNFGELYQYRRNPRLGRSVGLTIPELERTKFTISSEQAKLAMFNCFDLGFAKIRTHDSVELGESLKSLGISEEKVTRFTTCYDTTYGYCPGTRDAIACWAAVSMPKMVTLPKKDEVPRTTEEDEVEFKSVFTARPATSVMADPVFAAMLLGGNHNDNSYYKTRYEQIESVRELTIWAREYLEILDSLQPDIANLLRECLSWIASKKKFNVLFENVHVPYSLSMECLKGVLALDQDLDDKLLPQEQERQRQMKLKFCVEQIQCQHNYTSEINDAKREFRPAFGRCEDEHDRVGSGYYCALPSKFADFFDVVGEPSAQKRAQRVVVNRLMRGSLWSVHNGNTPDKSEASLQCSLTSRWLERHFTIYLS